MAKLVHSMIRVRDEAASLAFYHDLFDLEIADRLDFDSFNLIYLSNAEASFELELTVNKDRETPYDLGDGYGHLAVVVDYLDTLHAKAKAAGLAPRDIVAFSPGGSLLAHFFFIADSDGYQIEVIERGGRFT